MNAIWFLTELKNSHSKDKQKARMRKRRKRNSLADDVALLKSGLATKVLSGHSNRTNGTRDRRNHKRTKRFLSYPRFVEVMVVADHRMVLYHGSNLQHYILTLMSIVSIPKRRGFTTWLCVCCSRPRSLFHSACSINWVPHFSHPSKWLKRVCGYSLAAFL